MVKFHGKEIGARQLLKKEGVIFISIDDNEYANLKLLCDRIWGINNYIGTLIRKTVSQRAMAKHFNNQHEYCLIYSSNKDYFPLVGRDKDLSIYKNPDNDPNGEWKSTDPTMRDSKNNFGIKNPYTDRIDFPPTGRGWAFTKESFEKHLETGKIVFKRNYKKNERGFIYKSYKKELRSQNLLINSLEFSDNQFLNQVASKEQVDIFNDKVFDYPKPSVFIKELISYYPNDKNPIILDFFAGSGTTGQAVLELNKEDGGNRRFILCTNNENNICTDVTYQRLKTVITGVRNDNSKYSDGLRGTLHYYKCDFIPNVGNQDQAKYNLVEKVNHLLCILENTFELVVIKSKYFIYRNVNLQKYLYIYIDYYDQKSFDDFKDEIINTKCNSKVVYIYSNDSVIDESLLVALPKIEVKVIPSKIYEIYREIVEEIKRG